MFLLQMSGVPGSGKSTGAAHIVRTYGAVAVDYDVIKAKCPPGVEPAYDGLEVEVPDVRG